MKRKRKQLELTFTSQSVKSEVRIAFCSVLFEIDFEFLSFSVQLLHSVHNSLLIRENRSRGIGDL